MLVAEFKFFNAGVVTHGRVGLAPAFMHFFYW
jgi:hypothetical protein